MLSHNRYTRTGAFLRLGMAVTLRMIIYIRYPHPYLTAVFENGHLDLDPEVVLKLPLKFF
jgi:hypothetical protein